MSELGFDALAEARLHALARARSRIGLGLTAAVVTVYFGFIGAVAFARPVLGWMLAPGLSLGIALGAAVIVAAWLLTWIYVRWANRYYDPALRALRERLAPRSNAGDPHRIAGDVGL